MKIDSRKAVVFLLTLKIGNALVKSMYYEMEYITGSLAVS